ncbi:killer cell lectin-like receptor subfamily B member 1B allele B isoform X2 [Strix aluco]|uniref:killer cell lectin-like receptor subfamily B member 1B allele B isoform X2 n=1 Tax=Strix aluco TaxID=111821 RepID=UPI003DA6459B
MAATTIYARCDFATPKPDSPPRSAPSTCRKLPRPWWYWMLLGSGWVGTVLLVGVVLRLLQQHGGNNPIPSQDAEVLGSGCSWESCWTNSSQRATPEFKCSLSCFRLQLRQRLCEEQHQHPTGPSACWLCPTGWQVFGAKCYWISTKTESWEKAAKDCLDQRSQLVKLESTEEKRPNPCCQAGFLGTKLQKYELRDERRKAKAKPHGDSRFFDCTKNHRFAARHLQTTLPPSFSSSQSATGMGQPDPHGQD